MMKKRQLSKPANLVRWINRFNNVPVLVIGDLMLDRVLRGTVERISPEAPVPVIDIIDDTFTAGGAGNVVTNLQALGARPYLLSVRNDDEAGRIIVSEFRSRSLDTTGLLVDRSRPTTTKTRVIAGHQQVARLDFEKRTSLPASVHKELVSRLKSLIARHRVVVISDYGKGVVTRPLIQAALREAHRHRIPVIVDPKIEHFMSYKGVDCLTPNTKEAAEGMRARPPKTDADLVRLGWAIMRRLRSQSLLITRGEKGMALFNRDKSVCLIPTQSREVFDVTGAGDTVISAFALARAVGATYEAAAEISNYAASLVVAKVGTAVASQKDLLELLRLRPSR